VILTEIQLIQEPTFFLSDFLTETELIAQKNNEIPDISLIPTWILDIEQDKKTFYRGISMPFNVNNVDLSVNGNVLFGLIRFLLYGSDSNEWFTEDLQKILLDTVLMIEWSINENRILNRPDLALLYYPPIYDFYWFLSRTVFILNSYNKTLPFVTLEKIRDKLTQVMRGNGTNQLLTSSIIDGNYIYWQDFIGQQDLGWFGEPNPHPDDRMFSTAVALNALYDSWTEETSFCKRSWVINTPQSVLTTVAGAIRWLRDNALSDIPTYNSFFSGSMKGLDQNTFAFPANRLEYLNGTKLPPLPGPEFITNELIAGMSGVINRSEYQKQLKEKHFGFSVPVKFNGFNQNPFPFWSSTPLTQSVTILALSKNIVISECKPEN